MIAQLSKRIASFFVHSKVIESENEQVYEYGLELLISTLLNSVIALVLALFSRTLWQCICFLVVFIFLRKSAGGFHAKTHLGCCSILSRFHRYIIRQSCFKRPWSQAIQPGRVNSTFGTGSYYLGIPTDSKNISGHFYTSFICSATYELFNQKHCFVIEPPVGRGAVSVLSRPWGRTWATRLSDALGKLLRFRPLASFQMWTPSRRVSTVRCHTRCTSSKSSAGIFQNFIRWK